MWEYSEATSEEDLWNYKEPAKLEYINMDNT